MVVAVGGLASACVGCIASLARHSFPRKHSRRRTDFASIPAQIYNDVPVPGAGNLETNRRLFVMSTVVFVTASAPIHEEVMTIQQANIRRVSNGYLDCLAARQLPQVVFDKLHLNAAFRLNYNDCNTDFAP